MNFKAALAGRQTTYSPKGLKSTGIKRPPLSTLPQYFSSVSASVSYSTFRRAFIKDTDRPREEFQSGGKVYYNLGALHDWFHQHYSTPVK